MNKERWGGIKVQFNTHKALSKRMVARTESPKELINVDKALNKELATKIRELDKIYTKTKYPKKKA